jgi:hypothetical protein
MKTTFPSELTILQSAAGNPVDMARIADAALRQSLEEMRAQLSSQQVKMAQMMRLLERRTAVLSPAKGYSNAAYAASCMLYHYPTDSESSTKYHTIS